MTIAELVKQVSRRHGRWGVVALTSLVSIVLVIVAGAIILATRTRTMVVDLDPASRQRLLEELEWVPVGDVDFRAFEDVRQVQFAYGPVVLYRGKCDRVIVSSKGRQLSVVRFEKRLRDDQDRREWTESIRQAFGNRTGCTAGRQTVPFTVWCKDYEIFVEVKRATFGAERGLLGVCEATSTPD